MGEWILFQNTFKENRERMGAALFTTGPYIEMAISSGTLSELYSYFTAKSKIWLN